MEKELVRDEDTAISGSGSGSGITDLTGLETETDDLGRRILEHERETRRAKIEARQPFWRARPKSWVIDNITDEKEKVDEIGRPGHRRTASAGNARTDPPLNVPREWGKRSRRRGSWLRRHDSEGDILLTKPEQPEEPSQVDEDSIIPRRTVYTGDGWAAGVDLPRDSIETTPPSMRRLQRQASSPSSMQHMNTTLKSVDADEDFSATSLLTSTPAINQRNRKIDDLMKREIETVEKRGVTRRTLNQITEKFSNESLRPSTAPAAEPSRIPRRRSAASNKENEPVAGRGWSADGTEDQKESRNANSQAVTFKHPQKPSHNRNDSMSLLKRLARVSSLSPTPAKPGPESDEAVFRRASDPTEVYAEADRLGYNLGGAQQEDRKLKVEFDLPQQTTAIESIPSKVSEESEAKPVIERTYSIPNPPRSALQEVVNGAKDGLDLHIGDSTIASLENIIHPSTDTSSPSTPTKSSRHLKRRPVHSQNLPTSDDKNEQLIEKEIETLTKGLDTTKSTIHDANQGLGLLEHRIGNLAFAQVSTEPPPNSRPYTDHNGRTVCDHCGGRYTSVWRGLWVELRENFYTWDPDARYRLRLTWLGLTCALWWAWLLVETTLCSYYCHPRYAVSMEGYGVDPNAPEFPFVIPTLLLRPFTPIWRPIGVFVAWLSTLTLQTMFGRGSGGARSNGSARARPEGGAFGANAAQVLPDGDAARQVARSVEVGRKWVTTAAVVTSATSRRIVESTIDAVDRFARMWEDGIAAS